MRKPNAAQLALLMASVATAAETTCAIDCFQGLITNGPPADCKEATNYLCFCTMPTLQENFSKCADTSCGEDKSAAMTWANDLCAKLGKPVDLGPGEDAPTTDATTAVGVTTAVDAPASTAEETKQTSQAETTVPDAAQTTVTEAEKTDSKAKETSIETALPTKTSETSETCTTETTMTKTETTFAKATTAEGTAITTDEDGPVGTATGSGETATASSDAEINAGSIMAPGFLGIAGVVAALWQFV
ncbi:hypothetical protein FVEN_g4602 [Fusarium venenatum]|uniref:CFEM domain-containing protein n=2 Tax=Fusarium venenatum TaxID=56646 RepID=A0A2L2TQZ3_9HYPO|nr:uncharacterized protein FVRRES_02498 [Fusarium venenatum]KAG8357898.1 hypothetical protein FVEN_g4602 [Fusarium venenatum]CEI65986.1 unnamed protein product [Fusarium venenatum]